VALTGALVLAGGVLLPPGSFSPDRQRTTTTVDEAPARRGQLCRLAVRAQAAVDESSPSAKAWDAGVDDDESKDDDEDDDVEPDDEADNGEGDNDEDEADSDGAAPAPGWGDEDDTDEGGTDGRDSDASEDNTASGDDELDDGAEWESDTDSAPRGQVERAGHDEAGESDHTDQHDEYDEYDEYDDSDDSEPSTGGGNVDDGNEIHEGPLRPRAFHGGQRLHDDAMPHDEPEEADDHGGYESRRGPR
jgi:hypothetical protein